VSADHSLPRRNDDKCQVVNDFSIAENIIKNNNACIHVIFWHELCRVRRIAGWQEPGDSQSFFSGSAEFEIESDSIEKTDGSAALARITIQSVATIPDGHISC